jgi:hypothetical protein
MIETHLMILGRTVFTLVNSTHHRIFRRLARIVLSKINTNYPVLNLTMKRGVKRKDYHFFSRGTYLMPLRIMPPT